MTVQHLLSETISSAIGCDVASEAAQQLFENLNIKWQDFKLQSKDLQRYVYDSKDMGVTITTQDEGFIRKKLFHDAGDGRFIITNMTLWGFKKEYKKYPAPLVGGISFSSTLADVESALGPATQALNDPEMPFLWRFETYRISIHWPNKKNEIASVGYAYTPES